ncbi:MAG: UPF0061 protein YdiU, partial [uncultured Phycisphaerae bacterium]
VDTPHPTAVGVPVRRAIPRRPRAAQLHPGGAQRLLFGGPADAGGEAGVDRVGRPFCGRTGDRQAGAGERRGGGRVARGQPRAAGDAPVRRAVRRAPVRPLGRAARRRPGDHARGGRVPECRSARVPAQGRRADAVLPPGGRAGGAAVVRARIPVQRGHAFPGRAHDARAELGIYRRRGRARHVLRRQPRAGARRDRVPGRADLPALRQLRDPRRPGRARVAQASDRLPDRRLLLPVRRGRPGRLRQAARRDRPPDGGDDRALAAGGVRPRRDEHGQHVRARPDDRLRPVRVARAVRPELDPQHHRRRPGPLPLRLSARHRPVEPRVPRRGADAADRQRGARPAEPRRLPRHVPRVARPHARAEAGAVLDRIRGRPETGGGRVLAARGRGDGLHPVLPRAVRVARQGRGLERRHVPRARRPGLLRRRARRGPSGRVAGLVRPLRPARPAGARLRRGAEPGDEAGEPEVRLAQLPRPERDRCRRAGRPLGAGAPDAGPQDALRRAAPGIGPRRPAARVGPERTGMFGAVVLVV